MSAQSYEDIKLFVKCIKPEGDDRFNIEELKPLMDHLNKIMDIPYTHVTYFPLENDGKILPMEFQFSRSLFEGSVAQFIIVIFGEIAMMKALGRVVFEDLTLPEYVYDWFTGPKFGSQVVGERFHLSNYPFLMAIIKPSLGPGLTMEIINKKLSLLDTVPEWTAIKDDEMQGDTDNNPLSERVKSAQRYKRYVPVVNKDTLEEYLEVFSNTSIPMGFVNGSAIGFPMLHALSKKTQIPILSHLSFQDIYQHSFSPKLFAFLHRLFGADAMIVTIGGVDYFNVTQAEEEEMVHQLTRTDIPLKTTLPILGGGGRMHNLRQVIKKYTAKNIPFGVVFGTLIFGQVETPEEMAKKVIQEIKNL